MFIFSHCKPFWTKCKLRFSLIRSGSAQNSQNVWWFSEKSKTIYQEYCISHFTEINNCVKIAQFGYSGWVITHQTAEDEAPWKHRVFLMSIFFPGALTSHILCIVAYNNQNIESKLLKYCHCSTVNIFWIILFSSN